METNDSSKKIVKNAGWLIGAKIVQAILSLVVTSISARFLGPSNYGLISYAASVATFIAPIALLGLSNIQVQEYVNNKNEEGKILGTSVLMSIISSFICIIGATSFSLVADKGETETIIVVALYSTMLLFQSTELIIYWFQAKYLNKFTAIVGLIAYSSVSAYKIILLANGANVFLFALSNSLDYFLVSFILLIIYKKKGGQKICFDKSIAKRLLSKSKYYIIPNLMVAIFSQTDHIMIKQMMGEESTGYYQAALVCTNYLSFIFTALIDSMRPSIFEYKKSSQVNYKKSVTILFSIVFYIGLLAAVGMMAFSNLIIAVLYGDEYFSAIPALLILAWHPLLSYMGVARNVWVLAEEKQKSLWIINLVGAFANVVMNFLLIPQFGICGAAIASIITEGINNILFNLFYKPYRDCFFLMVKALNPQNIVYIIRKITKRGKNA